jgi:hypothetical protein
MQRRRGREAQAAENAPGALRVFQGLDLVMGLLIWLKGHFSGSVSPVVSIISFHPRPHTSSSVSRGPRQRPAKSSTISANRSAALFLCF